MKRNLFLLVFLLVLGKISAQTERYIYETTVNPDSINLVEMKVERTFLNIHGKQSVFVSENKLLKDSLMTVVRKQETSGEKKSKKDKPDFPKLANGKSLQPTFFNYFIKKDLENKTISLVESIGPKQIFYSEDRKLDWKILPETADFYGYKSQKATLNFGGRIWTAWFSPEIKISDGPYKFSGLPGLILKLEDDKGDYKFNFIKKIILQNAFQENLSPDAKQSTRLKFSSDKIALQMQMKQDGVKTGNEGFQNHRENGIQHMQSGRREGGMNGMPPNGKMDENPPDMQNGQNSSQNFGTNFGNYNSPNPIEIK